MFVCILCLCIVLFFSLMPSGICWMIAGSSSITWTRAMVSLVWSLVNWTWTWHGHIDVFFFFSTSPCQPEIVAGLTTSSFYAVHCQRRSFSDVQPDVSRVGIRVFHPRKIGRVGLERCNLGGLGDGWNAYPVAELSWRIRYIFLFLPFSGLKSWTIHDEHFLEVC